MDRRAAADDLILCAARIIAGGAPPPELREWLLLCAAGISHMIGRERRHPGRAELRERLRGLIRAARLIERELTDLVVGGLLVSDDGAALDLNRKGEVVQTLHDVAERTSAAVKRIPVGPGQHKH